MKHTEESHPGLRKEAEVENMQITLSNTENNIRRFTRHLTKGSRGQLEQREVRKQDSEACRMQ